MGSDSHANNRFQPFFNEKKHMIKHISAAFLISYFAILASSASAQMAEPKDAVAQSQGYADTQACEPIRPENAVKNKNSSTVKLAFLIGVDGNIQQSKLTKSIGDKILDQAALDAWTKCTFHPASTRGHAQVSWVMLSYKWKAVIVD